jgi:hypothetical protein
MLVSTLWVMARLQMSSQNVLIAEGNRLAFTQACAYPDGAKVFCVAMLELEGGKIARQTVVQAWDE